MFAASTMKAPAELAADQDELAPIHRGSAGRHLDMTGNSDQMISGYLYQRKYQVHQSYRTPV